MADLKRTIEIVFGGKDKLSPTITSVSKQLDTVSASVEKVAGPFSSMANGVIKADAALAGLAGAGLAYSITKFAGFEQTMLSVKSIMQASEPEYAAMTDLVMDLGKTTKFTAQEAADGLKFLGMSGMTAQDAMKALPEVLNLAQAAAMDLGNTADIVTNIMAGYGVKAANLGQVNDVLTATFTNSNTSLGELGEAFKMVGPVAKSMGFSIEETSATLGVLANAGYKAEMGGTALRNIMLALVAPAGNMGKLMKELGVDTEELGVDFSSSKNALDSLGVSVKDSSGQILPFSNILQQIKDGLSKIPDPADKAATLVEIFGKRGGPQMAALLQQGSGAVVDLEKKIDSMGGITKKTADDMESGLKGSLNALASAFDGISLAIGKAAKGVEDGLDGMSILFNAFSDAISKGAFKDIFDVFDDLSDEIKKFAENMADILPEALEKVDFKGFTKAINDLADELLPPVLTVPSHGDDTVYLFSR